MCFGLRSFVLRTKVFCEFASTREEGKGEREGEGEGEGRRRGGGEERRGEEEESRKQKKRRFVGSVSLLYKNSIIKKIIIYIYIYIYIK